MKKVFSNFNAAQRKALARIGIDYKEISRIEFDTADGEFEYFTKNDQSDELELFEEDKKHFVNLFLTQEHEGTFKYENADSDIRIFLWDETQEDETRKPEIVFWQYDPTNINIEYTWENEDGDRITQTDPCSGAGYDDEEIEELIKELSSWE